MNIPGKMFLLCAISTLLLGGCAEDKGPKAEILWDNWGVPHIYSEDDAGLFRGFGWAQMKAHGNLILRLYGQARGRAAEYWGEEHLGSDRIVHTLGVPERATAMFAAQSPSFRANLRAFADGINAYAAAHGEEIADELEVVLPVTPEDILAHEQRAIHVTFNAGLALGTLMEGAAPGSNAWAVGPKRSASGNALLLANPHLWWRDLFLFFEAHLVGPGVNTYGVALVGGPVIEIGFNDNLGWTHTVNTYDGTDLYDLTLSGDGYVWNGGTRAFEIESKTLKVKQPDGTLREEELSIKRSIHGPVLTEKEGQATAIRIAGLDQAHMVEQWWDMGRAGNLQEFEAALARLQIPMFNVVYADRDGHILYLYGGQVPRRTIGDWDYWQGKVPGTDVSNLWTETLGYDELPKAVDPPSGWVQNANDPPWSATYPTIYEPEDFQQSLSPRGVPFRPQSSIRLIDESEKLSFEEFIARKHSTRMELAERLLDDLIPAAREHGGKLAHQAADVLEAWDRNSNADSRGAVLFMAWVREAKKLEPLFATPWQADHPRTTPDGLADPAAAAAALETAANTVMDTHGTLDIPWGDVYRLRYAGRDLPAAGGPSEAGVFRTMNFVPDGNGGFQINSGETYVAAMEFGDEVRARALLSYGNASQPHSKHMGDQLELLAAKKLRPVWRNRADIEANLEFRKIVR